MSCVDLDGIAERHGVDQFMIDEVVAMLKKGVEPQDVMDAVDHGEVPRPCLIQFIIRVTKEFFPEKQDEVRSELLANFQKEPRSSSTGDNVGALFDYDDLSHDDYLSE